MKCLIKKQFTEEIYVNQLAWAADFNIRGGLVCPIFDGHRSIGLFHFVVDPDNVNNPNSDAFKTQFSTFCRLLNQKIQFLHQEHQSQIKLTARESECLVWAANGKTSWEIAKILSLSEHTVREYLASAKKKMEASNLTETVLKAYLHQQLDKDHFGFIKA